MSIERPPKCNWKSCPGWTIDWLGFVRPCGSCARFATDDEAAAATAASAFIASFEVLPEERAPEPCSPHCRGWTIVDRGGEMPGFDIERCVDCGLFANDDEALDVAVKWLLEHLTHPDKYPKTRPARTERSGITFAETVGRTVARVETGQIEGVYGSEPTVTFHFTDGTYYLALLYEEEEMLDEDWAIKRAGSPHMEDVVEGRARCGICGWIDQADPKNATVRAWHGDSFTDTGIQKGAPAPGERPGT